MQNTATFTIDHYVDTDGHRFTASWVGLVRINTGWHPTAAAAWNALTVALAPHLARTTRRALHA